MILQKSFQYAASLLNKITDFLQIVIVNNNKIEFIKNIYLFQKSYLYIYKKNILNGSVLNTHICLNTLWKFWEVI